MPRGPLQLAPTLVTLAASATVKYKLNVFKDLENHGVEVAIGIGNRASDIDAYQKFGVPAAAIFIKGPKFDA